MKTHFLTAAFLLTACCGCQSSSPLLSWMGHDNADKLAALSSDDSSSEAKLPPPTNANPRNSRAAVSSIDEHLQLGEAELNLGRFTQARIHFESVLKEQPQHGKANHRMGVLSDKLGEYANAERHYRVAILIDPRDVAIMSDLGYSYWLQGRYADSERVLLQARQVDPQYKNAIANLGMLYGTTGREQEALAMFRQIGDEAAAQNIMQQVAALAPNSNTPTATASSMSPVTLASHEAPSTRDASRVDLDSVNEPTRKILELMEEGRRQQELAKQARDREQAAAASVAQQRQVPPFVQNRPPAQQGYPPQMAGVDPFQSQPNPQSGRSHQQPHIPDAYLSQALANIDRSDRRTPPDGPITLGPNTNSPYNAPPQAQPNGYPTRTQITSSAGPRQYAPPYAQSPQPAQAHPSMSPNGYPQPSQSGAVTMQPMDANQAAQPQQPVANPNTSFEPAPVSRPAERRGSSAVITYGTPRRNPSYTRGPSARQPLPLNSPMSPPNSNGVRQASGFTQHPSHPSAAGQQGFDRQPVEHAHHQQLPGVQTPIDLLSTSAQPNTTPPLPVDTATPQTPGSQWPLIPSSTTDPNDPYQQARRQAAIMGLGAGPEQLFPYVQQTQRAAPGSNSMLNGAQYPPPQRQLPSGMNPADLAPAFAAPQATNLTPGHNYQGQLLPHVAAPINTPTQFGAPASASFQQFEQPGYTGQPATTYTQLYEDVRQQNIQQLNGLINQTYGQPVQTPPSGISALPSQTYNAPQTQQLSQYTSPQTGSTSQATNTPPPRWTPPQLNAPSSQGTNIQQYGTPQSNNAGQRTQLSSNQGVVVPEQYRPTANPGYRSNPTYQQSTPASTTPQRVNTMPVIVPGER